MLSIFSSYFGKSFIADNLIYSVLTGISREEEEGLLVSLSFYGYFFSKAN